MTSSQPIQSLEAVEGQLWQSLTAAYDPWSNYIPINRIIDILHADQIEAILPDCGVVCPNPRARSVFIHQRYQKILAVLILTRLHPRLQQFIDDGVDDAKLPILNKPQENRPFRLCLHDSDEPLRYFEGWDNLDIANFDRRQWWVMAPVFKRGVIREVAHYQFLNRVPLPFRPVTGRVGQIAASWYTTGSVVTGIEIHGDHTTFEAFSSAHARPQFAVKTHRRCRPDTRALFGHEVGVLKRLNARTMIPDHSTVTETLGIIHEMRQDIGAQDRKDPVTPGEPPYYGLHADIRPANLLWFKDWDAQPGTGLCIIQLADFGSTEFHDTEAWSNAVLPNSDTRTYLAPEVALSQPITGAYDIWGLGCVFLEFLSWLVLTGSGPTSSESKKDSAHQRVGRVQSTRIHSISSHGRVTSPQPW
ncbi:hypothetical protein QBC35DRAFT_479407 [Podospora australis]|uniref:Protein kinase domain-containing protein n=1 Tax=Podospora australis TaxID=1536484 RepID=A0AAN6WIW4_9PEZI|nr:hypothetical protein QBC35DRAFT_479407 [Podospora australis]